MARGDAPPAAGDDAAGPPPGQPTGKTGKFRKDKPWDNDTIDHWRAAGAGAAATALLVAC